jgi:hypothetical protein
MAFNNFRSIGRLYVQNPEGTFDVKILDWSTGDVGDVDEHNAMVHMTQNYKDVCNLITRSMLALAQSHRRAQSFLAPAQWQTSV